MQRSLNWVHSRDSSGANNECQYIIILFSKLYTSYHLRQLYSSVPLLLCSSSRNCCTILDLPISSEIIDRFWHSRCLKDRINLFYMIGSFASCANVSLRSKKGTKKIIPLLSIKSSKKPQIKNFYETDPPKSGNSDSKYNIKILKNQKSNSKKTPYSSKKSKTYIRRPQIKKFYKTDPPKSGNSDSKYNFKISKSKTKLKKTP